MELFSDWSNTFPASPLFAPCMPSFLLLLPTATLYPGVYSSTQRRLARQPRPVRVIFASRYTPTTIGFCLPSPSTTDSLWLAPFKSNMEEILANQVTVQGHYNLVEDTTRLPLYKRTNPPAIYEHDFFHRRFEIKSIFPKKRFHTVTSSSQCHLIKRSIISTKF
jgi:hypothetical protein